MTPRLDYRILNVFTDGDNPSSGNQLCVFDDPTGLSDGDMQDLARQLNLSETTFVTPGGGDVSANVRIFTPSYELPFAGHPTLGTAYVVRELSGAGDAVLLRMRAGDIPVDVAGNAWTLQANAPTSFPVEVPRPDLSAMIGLTADRIAAEALWVDTGTLQLILPLRSAATSGPRRPIPSSWPSSPAGPTMSRWSISGRRRTPTPSRPGHSSPTTARRSGTRPPDRPAPTSVAGSWRTESWWIRRRIHQGSAIKRPSVLDLAVGQDGTIRVSGAVREVGAGTFTL